jgi:hypothetical protein
VDRVGEQGDAAREHDHNELEEGRGEQADKGPLDGPYAPLRGGYGGVYRTVCVAMVIVLMIMVVRHTRRFYPMRASCLEALGRGLSEDGR